MAQTSALYSGSTTATSEPWRKATAWFCCWYRSVLASSVGGAYSSGIRNSLLRRAARPRPVRLVITDTGADRISDTTIGASHQRNAASNQATSAVQSTPMTICEPCRRRASPQGCVIAALRRVPLHRPAEEGRSDEHAVEEHAHRRQQHREQRFDQHRQQHPQPPAIGFSPWMQTSSTLSSLGRNSSVMVAENSAMASCGCQRGHSG